MKALFVRFVSFVDRAIRILDRRFIAIGMLEATNLSFAYNAGRPDAISALEQVNLRVAPGELVAIIGQNGSGKSTLARLLAAILAPTSGSVVVDGRLSTPEQVWEIRRRVGMVFQNPDDQLIANTVIDDVAFGPENLGLPRDEIERRVRDALAVLGLADIAHAQIAELSNGEKQRVAIAGVLAMQPAYVILDEPTTMLTPRLARDLIALVHDLRDSTGLAVLHITHFMYEAVHFDRVVVMDRGRVLLDGPPREVFAHAEELRAVGLAVPLVTEVARRLRGRGVALPTVVLTAQELAEALPAARIGNQPPAALDQAAAQEHTPVQAEQPDSAAPQIDVRDLHFSYLAGTPLAREALRGVTCALYAGETLAVLGGTQAGKSTLVEFCNALRMPEPGHVFFEEHDIAGRDFDLDRLRQSVGMVFQQPESQLFEDTVGKDVAYVPRRRGLAPAESRALVERALMDVGLDYETFRLRYIYALSGGQKRRVAIAGVLAAQPRILILDEPTAGLDPRGRAELIALIGELKQRLGLTIMLVGNAVDALAELADRAIILHAGRVVLEGELRPLLRRAEELHRLGLELSEPAEIALTVRVRFPDLPTDLLHVDELEQALLRQIDPVACTL